MRTNMLVVCLLLAVSMSPSAFAQCKSSGFPETAVTVDIGAGKSLAGDGLGAYVDGMTYVEADIQEAGNLWTSFQEPVRRKPRLLSFDLNGAVNGSLPLGTIQDPRGQVHVFYKLDPVGADGLRQIHSFGEIPPTGEPVQSERTELWVQIGGIQHLLMFGGTTWPKNTCVPSQGVPLSAPGSTPAWVTRTGDVWTVYSEPTGLIGRLWNYQDPFSPIDRGLYVFDFYVTFTKKSKGH